jgi:hypothetical protein
MPEEGLEPPVRGLSFPVFTGDSADLGRQIGLFCQRACTKARSDGVPSGVLSRPRISPLRVAERDPPGFSARATRQTCQARTVRHRSAAQRHSCQLSTAFSQLLDVLERLPIQTVRIEHSAPKRLEPRSPFLIGHLRLLDRQVVLRLRWLHVVQVIGSRNAHDSLRDQRRRVRRCGRPRSFRAAASKRSSRSGSTGAPVSSPQHGGFVHSSVGSDRPRMRSALTDRWPRQQLDVALRRLKRAVSHVLHQLPQGVAGRHQEAGVRVAALVQRDRLEALRRPPPPCSLSDLPQHDRDRADSCALPPPLRHELVQQDRPERLPDRRPAPGAGGALRLAYDETIAIELDVRPVQAPDLSAPKAGVEREGVGTASAGSKAAMRSAASSAFATLARGFSSFGGSSTPRRGFRSTIRRVGRLAHP